MSYITLNTQNLFHNYSYLDQLFARHQIEWAIVAKLLCGNERFLQSLLEISNKEICDSRLSNLKNIKKLSPKTQTVYIKPPAKRLAESIVRYADVSFNTEYETIKVLSEEAVRQKINHKIVVMVEMGELREGIMARNLPRFYKKAAKLPNIKIVGIGTNLNCLNGILPDQKKMVKLSHFKKITEEYNNTTIPYISAGSSVTIPLLLQDKIPDEVNHFRIGESLFFGTDVYNDSVIHGMYQDVFTLTAEIIEITEKPMIPAGKAGTNLTGDQPQHKNENKGKKTYRAIVDVGILDIELRHIEPVSKNINIIGASSDMMIIDLHDNHDAYRVGDNINFKMNYMSVLRAMNSDYIDKKIECHIKGKELKILENHN